MWRSAQTVPRSIGLIASFLVAWLIAEERASAAIDVPTQVADIRPGPGGSSPDAAVTFGNRVIFEASNLAVGQEPWITDGTAAGTTPLEVTPGAGSSLPGDFTDLGDEVVFLAFEPTGGDELWRTDGTQAGTQRVLDINSGPASANPRGFLDIGDEAIFRADDGTNGVEPWRTDGSAGGTSRIADINPGAPSSSSGFFFPERMGDFVFFNATSPATGSELWRTPVAGGVVQLVANVSLVGGSDPLQLTPSDGNLFFLADDGIVGRELWRSTGQPGNFTLVNDFDGAATDSGAASNGMVAFGSGVYLDADGSAAGNELWRADAGGAQIVSDINGAGDSNPGQLTPVGSSLLFYATTPGNGRELWRTDGVPGGTTEIVKDINPTGSSPCAIAPMTVVGDEAFFCANDGASGNELWRTDGTNEGTVRVGDINPGAASSSPQPVIAHGDTFYFNASDGTTGTELWAVDTGAPDTTLVEGPGKRTRDDTPEFTLSSPAVDLAKYDCSPTGAAGTFSDCGGRSGEIAFPDLKDGNYDLTMRGVDVRDNADASPLVEQVIVDTKAPKVKLRGELKPSGTKVVGAKLTCKKSELSGPCTGKLTLVAAKGMKGSLGKARFSIKPGKSDRAKVKLTKRGQALFAAADGTVKVRAKGKASDALGNRGKLRGAAKFVP